MPKVKLLSHLNVSNPSDLNINETSDTWELSIAWRLMPVELQSHVASFSKSFTASKTFFRSDPWTRRASNILNSASWCSYKWN